jgi:predicted RNA-binding Zn-ribbon protein involved in translation (DUF1610 family)
MRWFITQYDDYIEEVGVGTSWWILVGTFGVGMPIVAGLTALASHLRYPTGTYVILSFIGICFGGTLRLLAREREKYRAAAIDQTGNLAAIRKKTWGEFEILVGEVIRRQGWVVKERGGFQSDRGMDLIAERKNARAIIQCKHWLSWSVPEGEVKKVYADMKRHGFTEAWLVTCGRFTKPAQSWNSSDFKLVDGPKLLGLLQDTGAAIHRQTNVGTETPDHQVECPNCGTVMDRRTNSYTEIQFWSCPSSSCGWTMDDPPPTGLPVRCSRGHPMVASQTTRGVTVWRCSQSPTCERMRLS